MRYQLAEEIQEEIGNRNAGVYGSVLLSITELQKSLKDEQPDTTQIEPQIKSLYSETKSLILLVEKNQIMLDHIHERKEPFKSLDKDDLKKLADHQALRQDCLQKLEDILGLIEGLNQRCTSKMTATEKTLSDYKKNPDYYTPQHYIIMSDYNSEAT